MRRVGYWLESLELIGAFITRPLRWFVLIYGAYYRDCGGVAVCA